MTERAWTAAERDTAALMARARSVLAYGGLDGIIHRPLFHETGAFPQFAVAADGCRITDSTGRTYVDWSMGWGPVILGYRHPRVEAAIHEQLHAGPTVPLMHPIEVEVAEQICDLVPSAEMVVFGKNGSDALAVAVRTARAATGREVILQHGFHGFHEWYLCQFPDVQGIPARQRPLVDSFPYNDLAALAQRFDEHDGQVAAVVMEPLNTFVPHPGYLQGVKALAERHGAVLIFDEVLTGFRTSKGGAQLTYGVEPDLTCLGKAMGNGMPLSALAGQRDLMRLVPSVGFGLTFRGETLSLAAARATLSVIATEPVNDHLASVGEAMRTGFEARSTEIGLPCQLLGHPSRLTLGFEPTDGHVWEVIRATFLRECMRNGVLTNGVLLPSYAHDDAAVHESLEAMGRALEAVREQLHRQDSPVAHPMGGSPWGPRSYDGGGWLEKVACEDDLLVLSGWLTVGGVAPEAVALLAPDKTRHATEPHPSGFAGWFTASIPLAALSTGEGTSFDLVAVTATGETWHCHVLLADARAVGDGPFPLDDGVLYL